MTKTKKTLTKAVAAIGAGGEVDDFGADVTEGRAGILVRVPETVRRDLKIIAARRGTTIQALLAARINELLAAEHCQPLA